MGTEMKWIVPVKKACRNKFNLNISHAFYYTIIYATSFEGSRRQFCTDPISIIKNSTIMLPVVLILKELGQFVAPPMRLFLSTLWHSVRHSTNNSSSSHDKHGQYFFITWYVAGCSCRDKPSPNACHVSLLMEAWSIQMSSPALWTSTLLSAKSKLDQFSHLRTDRVFNAHNTNAGQVIQNVSLVFPVWLGCEVPHGYANGP